MNEVRIYRIYIGQNRKEGHNLSTGEVVDTCEEAFAEYGIPGVTYIFGKGSWEGEQEQCTIAELVFDKDPEAAKLVATIASSLAQALNQEKILLTITDGLAGLVNPSGVDTGE